jgi:hypothetical protein
MARIGKELTLSITAGRWCTTQRGTSTGPLKLITVATLEPVEEDTGPWVEVTLIAEREDDPRDDEIAGFYLTREQLDDFIQMLQQAR